MINNLPHHIYHRAREKYLKFKSRLDRNIAQGTFRNFTRRKQRQLIQKVERLRKRVQQLQLQLKLAGTGLALGMLLSATPAQAQSTLGPFNENVIENPLPPPLPHVQRPAPTYVDLDADGDQDLVVGKYTYLKYFKNIGTEDDPYFEEIGYGDSEFPFTEVLYTVSTDEAWVPTFADIDGDGDFDLLLGTDNKYGPGQLYYFRNNGTSSDPLFEWDNTNGPFVDSYGTPFGTLRYAHPVLVDLDKDGDSDLLLGGYYDSSTDNYLLQYFENTGSPTNPVFEQKLNSLTNAVNNIYFSNAAPFNVADLDEDGDLDVFLSLYDKIIYFRNDEGIFAREDYANPIQTGPWIPNPETPGDSQGNPFDEINDNVPDDFNGTIILSFADLDNDGDLDVTIGYDRYSYYGYENLRSFIYHENKGQGVFERKDGINSPVDGIDLGYDGNTSFADIDHDGDLDMLTSGTYSISYFDSGCECTVYQEITQARLFIKSGDEFTEAIGPVDNPFLTLPLKPDGKLQLIDLDQDGDFDLINPYQEYLVYGYYSQAGIQFFENVEGTYIERTGTDNPFDQFTVTYENLDLDLGDLDDDGLLDLILAQSGEELQPFENTGTLSDPIFQKNLGWDDGFLASIYDGGHPKLLDLDNDGDLDIVSGKYNNIWYYENIGDAETPEFIEYRESNYLDGDGNQVLAENNPFNGIDLNGFNQSPNFNDFDGDGDVDLIIGGEEGTFFYYKNDNPAPVATITANINVEGNTAVELNPAVAITDSDNDLISEVTVSIIDYDEGNEILTYFSEFEPITDSFNSQTGVLTLRGVATVAEYSQAIGRVTYQYTGSKPASGGRTSSGAKTVTLNRVISFLVLDLDKTTPLPSQVDVAVTFPNLNPVVAGTGTPITYINAPIAIGPALTLADGDDVNLEGATIAITSGLVNTEDQLLFSNQNGITGNYNSATGVLTLTGISSLANYQTAIQSIQYNNTSATPNPQQRTVSFTITDGEDISNTIAIDVGVTAAPNVAPVLGGTLSDVTFSTGAVVIANSLTVTDADDTDLTGATVAISTGLVSAEDQLQFTNQNGITGSYSSTTGILTLTGTSSVANYQTAIRSIRYNNTASTPNTQNRVVSFQVTDGTDASNTVTATVLVVIPNSPPQISTITQSTQIGTTVTVDLSSFLSDPDNDLDLSTLQILAQPTSGAVATITGTVLEIDYSATDFAGTDQLTIQVCDLSGACTQGIITVEVEGEVIVYNGFSPNGDSKNAYFRIANIQVLEPNNKVSIFNRWGSLVFEIDNYDNDTRRFEGNNQNGNPLPTGVYFYKIEFSSGTPAKTGYVTLKR